MYWQPKLEREGVSMTLNATYKLDLPEDGLLSAIFLEISGANVSGWSSAGGDWRILDKISRIKVLGDGTDEILNLTGKEAHFMAWSDQGIVPPSRWRNYAAEDQFEYFLLNFGRFAGDNKYGLPLHKWDHVELQITNAATSSHFAALAVDVVLLLLQDAGFADFPGGYFRKEEWKTWTTVRNSWEYATLPSLLPFRRIVLRLQPDLDASNLEETGIDNLADQLKFTLKTGGITVYDHNISYLRHLYYMMKAKEVLTNGWWSGNADAGFDVGIGHVIGFAGTSLSKDGAGSSTVPTFETANRFTQKAESAEADSPIGFLFRGTAFQNCIPLYESVDPDVHGLLDPNIYKEIKVDVHTRDQATAADGDAAIIIERLVKP